MLEIDDEGPLRIERTTKQPGHYTIWGEPLEILATVVAVIDL